MHAKQNHLPYIYSLSFILFVFWLFNLVVILKSINSSLTTSQLMIETFGLVLSFNFVLMTGYYAQQSGYINKIVTILSIALVLLVIIATDTIVASTQTDTPEATPTITSESTPPVSENNDTVSSCETENPFLVNQCRANPETPELVNWRLYLGAVIGIQYLVAYVVAHRLGNKTTRAGLIWGAVGILLAFTKVGEWIYNLILWILSWGAFGKVILVIMGLFSGFAGVGNLCIYIIGAHIFNDINVLMFCALPSVGLGFAVLLFSIVIAMASPNKPPNWED